MTPTRIFDFLDFQLNQKPLEKTLSTKYNGKWESISTQSFAQQANWISCALIKLGVQPQDKIAMISSNNRTEWSVIDMGILQIEAVNVPIYPTVSSDDYKYILNHSESQYCFVSDEEVYKKLLAIKDQVASLKEIYCFDPVKGCKHWSELLELGKKYKLQNEVDKLKSNVQPDSLATIIYTSGTTGTPKGVMLSHDNVVSNVISSSNRLPLKIGTATALSFLPLCHIFERMILYVYIYNSIKIYFAESPDTIADNLKEVKPNVITAVPRFIEKVYDKIHLKGRELSSIKKKLFYWAINVGLRYKPYKQNGMWYELKLKIARKLVFSKWKEALGGNLGLIACGSAALQTRLIRVFTAAGVAVVEGYGLTETSPVISVNDVRNNGFRIGTVGKVIDGVEVKIAEDGEILCKGPNVMIGYYKNPEETEEVINHGYLHTGDLGELDKDGFLKITGRKKDLFKTSGGKYIAPQVIENKMKQSLFIEHIMVIGEGKKMPAALIQPNFEHIKNWMCENQIEDGNTPEEICRNAFVIKAVEKDIEEFNQDFGKWEQIKKFALIPETWSIAARHLTPTLKVKRKTVLEKYKSLVKEIYT